MWSTSFVALICLAIAIQSHPLSSDTDSVKLSEDKQDFSNSSITQAPPVEEILTPRKHKKRSNDIKDILKELNLPTNFAEPRSSGSAQLENSVPAPLSSSSSAAFSFTQSPIINPSGQLDQTDTSTTTSAASIGPKINASRLAQLTKMLMPLAITLPTAGPFADDTARPPRQGMFVTGNTMLDKIMNCPCAKEQLERMGVKPIAFSNQPDAAIYRDPPYGMDADNLGPGDVIATNLKNVGGSTGNVFGQILRLLLGFPGLAISVLKPLVVGLADTLAQTTEAAAEVAGATAKSVPTTIRTAAVVLKRVLQTFGDVTGALLNLLANLIATAGAAKTSFAGTLPFIFDGIGDMTSALGGQVTAAVDLVSGITDIVSTGVVNAGKTGGNLFSGLIEGSKGFTNGLLNGIKYGVNDETPPADQAGGGGEGWRR